MSLMSATAPKNLGHPECAVVEDRLQVRFHEPRVSETAEDSEGEDISNDVAHQSSPIHTGSKVWVWCHSR